MKIEFRDQRLALIRSNNAAVPALPISVAKSVQERLLALEAAPDEQTLNGWKSLKYKSLDNGTKSVAIDAKWRIVFTLNESFVPPSVVILDFENISLGRRE